MSISTIKTDDCFSFFSGGPACKRCLAAKRCKAILVTHGFNLIGDFLEHLMGELPEKGIYQDTDRIGEMIEQLLKPEVELAKDAYHGVTVDEI